MEFYITFKSGVKQSAISLLRSHRELVFFSPLYCENVRSFLSSHPLFDRLHNHLRHLCDYPLLEQSQDEKTCNVVFNHVAIIGSWPINEWINYLHNMHSIYLNNHTLGKSLNK